MRGVDGETPYIKDGYWWIGDTNTEGTDGINGNDGKDGKDGKDGEDGITPKLRILESGGNVTQDVWE